MWWWSAKRGSLNTHGTAEFGRVCGCATGGSTAATAAAAAPLAATERRGASVSGSARLAVCDDPEAEWARTAFRRRCDRPSVPTRRRRPVGRGMRVCEWLCEGGSRVLGLARTVTMAEKMNARPKL